MKSIFDISVSYYRSYQDNEGVTVTLHDLLTTRRPEHARILERVRAATDDAEKNRYKKQLPLFTPSAHLVNRKADVSLADKLICYTGFMQFDIDPKGNPDMNACQVRDAMAGIPFVAFVGLSASGRGVWGLVRIGCPEQLEKHYQHFRHVVEGKTGIKLDTTKGSGATDLRYISHDAEARFKYEAVPLPLPAPKATKPKPPFKPNTPRTFAGRTWREQGGTVADAELLVKEVVERGINLLDDYQKWFAVGSGFAREFGESGRAMFHAVSQFDARYDARRTDKDFSGWVKSPQDKAQIGAFFNLCKERALLVKDLRTQYFDNSPRRFAPPTKPRITRPEARPVAMVAAPKYKTSVSQAEHLLPDEKEEKLQPGTHIFTNHLGRVFPVTMGEDEYPANWDF